MIQIDALSRKQLEYAIEKGKVPFLKNLLDHQYYHLSSHYSGMPCSTAAVQAELFYGVKSAVPAFRFYERDSDRIFTMFNPPDVVEIEHRLEKKGKPLLAEGSAYSNIYTGGSRESHFCISGLEIHSIFKGRHILGFTVMTLFYFYSLMRTGVLILIEAGLAIFDFFKGIIQRRDLFKELKFVPSRVAMCVLLRELIVIGAKIDIARGVPIIQLNFMGYHEQSHRRGATSRFAHWTFRGIDDAVKRIYKAGCRSAVREYEVWLYSDHGQIDTIPYQKAFGKSLQQSVAEAYDELESASVKTSKKIGFLARIGLRKPSFFVSIFGVERPPDSDNPVVTALGPMGHIYLMEKSDINEKKRLADHLIRNAHIPIVFFIRKNEMQKQVEAWTEQGHFILPDQADMIFDKKTPFYEEMVKDFIEMCHASNCGDLIVCGKKLDSSTCYSFAVENGSHGGITSEEAEGFVLIPKHRICEECDKGYLRPVDLRNAAFGVLQEHLEKVQRKTVPIQNRKKTFRLMTYNVHGCIGMDGRLSPRRVADVIIQYQPDIVGLQELDVERMRSGKEDQALLIADYLNMDFHFHASLRIAEESFGDAILSSFPMKLIKKDGLSRQPRLFFLEPRGALNVQVEINSTPIQVINTHLGLNIGERLNHIRELLGQEWLGYPEYEGPAIVCGDFNAFPGSGVFKVFESHMRSVQAAMGGGRHKGTWFGRYPLVCVDHIFISPHFKVVNVIVGDSFLARMASDHRPIIADLELLM